MNKHQNNLLLSWLLSSSFAAGLENSSPRKLAQLTGEAVNITDSLDSEDRGRRNEENESSFVPEIESRIVGGTRAPANEFPWYASSSADPGLCGASLIAPNLLLSAAHCQGAFRNGIYVNTTQLRRNGIFASVQAEIPHPDYDDFSISNDFMIIRLNRDIEGVPNIPLNLDEETSPQGGETMRVMGFGRTQFEGNTSPTLLETTLTAVDHNSCRNDYIGVNRIDQSIMLCAAGNGRGSCQGDSGGPLLENGRQVGIVSFGVGCANGQYPGVYARTSGAKDFIQSFCSVASGNPAWCDGVDASQPPPTGGDTANSAPIAGRVRLIVRYNGAPWQTSYEIQDKETGDVVEQGPNYNPGRNEAWAETFRLTPGGSYTLRVEDSQCNGMRGLFSNGYASISSSPNPNADNDGSDDVLLGRIEGDFACFGTLDFVVPLPEGVTTTTTTTTTATPSIPVSSTPSTPSTQWECEPLPSRSDFSCVFKTRPFPITTEPSFLFTICTTQFPTDPYTECNRGCGVFLGELNGSTQICSSCEILPNEDDGFRFAYDCSGQLTGTCVGRTIEGACIDNSNSPEAGCEDDVSARISLSDSETGSCSALAEGSNYRFLCDFTDIAFSCPKTCGVCGDVALAEDCKDLPGVAAVSLAPGGMLSCGFLKDNFQRFSFSCNQANVATLCPGTCGVTECVAFQRDGGRNLRG